MMYKLLSPGTTRLGRGNGRQLRYGSIRRPGTTITVRSLAGLDREVATDLTSEHCPTLCSRFYYVLARRPWLNRNNCIPSKKNSLWIWSSSSSPSSWCHTTASAAPLIPFVRLRTGGLINIFCMFANNRRHPRGLFCPDSRYTVVYSDWGAGR